MRRLRFACLIAVLIAVSIIAFWINSDWVSPYRIYSGLSEIKTIGPNVEEVNAVQAEIRTHFGRPVDIGYSGSMDFQSGDITWSYTMTLPCGFLPSQAMGRAFLEKVQASGWPLPKKLDFSMSCPVNL